VADVWDMKLVAPLASERIAILSRVASLLLERGSLVQLLLSRACREMPELMATAEIFRAVGFNTFTKVVKKSYGWEVRDSSVITWNYQA
jgi:hypothetical protein